MALQLILGGAGSGKSYRLYQTIIERAQKDTDKDYLVIVPEQYTMEIQKKLVSQHPDGGIMNIDILSFPRLAYRVFGELGIGNEPVLDDTGKSLIVRTVLEQHKKEFQIFGGNLNKPGFVEEVKSVISEMLQYAVTPHMLAAVQDTVADSQMLQAKIHDLQVVYEAFKEYISRDYITSEEVLEVLTQVAERSELLKDSVLAIDGFTGFTPVQYQLLERLLPVVQDIYITLTIDEQERLNVQEGMENIFFLTKDTIAHLYQLSDAQHIPIEKPVICNYSSKSSRELEFLEKNIFRNRGARFLEKTEQLRIFRGSNPKEEIAFAAAEILRLTREEGYRYRDIAVISGDIGTYGEMAANIMKQNDIPAFIDNKRNVLGNPLVELIRSALAVEDNYYSYESVFRYLRTGMTAIAESDIDELDNYCLAMGIRGSKAWHREWTANYYRQKHQRADLEHLNGIRVQIVAALDCLSAAGEKEQLCVRDRLCALYEFLMGVHAEERMLALAAMFEQQGDKSRAGEYQQIYGKIMELLDKVCELMGSECLKRSEYIAILDAGFQEIKVGLIPPSADCVIVGDIERTRLENIKVLFFAGVNDGIVPKHNDSSGILSEFDREKLEQQAMVLSPGARQKAFTQKFYLYLNLSKPSEKLYVTFAGSGLEGKGIRASYLIHTLMKMFPGISVMDGSTEAHTMEMLRIPKALCAWTKDTLQEPLEEEIARLLYGDRIEGSVTRLEEFARCEFAHFCDYGMALTPREEYQVQVQDIGTILHSALEQISRRLKLQGAEQGDETSSAFTNLEPEVRKALVSQVVDEVAKEYGNAILMDNKRNQFMIERLKQLADRTMWAIGKQLSAEQFVPEDFEISYRLPPQKLENGSTLELHGIIDRIDICEDEDNVYVKIIDYKSGAQDFDLQKTYYGLKLQLIAYMQAAVELEQQKHPEKKIIPTGVFYYNIKDPVVEKKPTPEENEQQILKELDYRGIANADVKPAEVLGENSEVVKKDNRISTTQFEQLDSFGKNKMKELASRIAQGSIRVNPYKRGQEKSCAYCDYRAICGFYEDVPGMGYRRLAKLDREEIWRQIGEN